MDADLADAPSPDSSTAPAIAGAGRDPARLRAAETAVRRFVRRVLSTDAEARRCRALLALARVRALAVSHALRRTHPHV
jgi:hypothetical protein